MILYQIINYPKVQTYVLKILAALGVLFVTWLINKIVQRSLSSLQNKPRVPAELFVLVRKVVKLLIYAIGLITALQHLGAHVDTILTSLGIGGLAISFALKDMLTNIISGIIIIAYRPFSIGNYISVKTNNNVIFEGKVIDINFRYVTIEAQANKTIIPNSTIVSTPVIVSKNQIN